MTLSFALGLMFCLVKTNYSLVKLMVKIISNKYKFYDIIFDKNIFLRNYVSFVLMLWKVEKGI